MNQAWEMRSTVKEAQRRLLERDSKVFADSPTLFPRLAQCVKIVHKPLHAFSPPPLFPPIRSQISNRAIPAKMSTTACMVGERGVRDHVLSPLLNREIRVGPRFPFHKFWRASGK